MKNFFILVACLLAQISSVSFANAENELFSPVIQEFKKAERAKVKNLSHSRHAPILLDHGRKTENVVVLFHGLYESPRTILGLAKEFHKSGMNVYLPILPGHWNRNPNQSDQVTFQDWLKEVDASMKFARKLGSKTLVAGFSMGGVLATYAAIKYPKEVEGLFVWSPAFGLSGKANLAASLGYALGFDGNSWGKIPADGVNTPYFSLKMATQLQFLHKYITRNVIGNRIDTGKNLNPNLLYGWDIAPLIQVPTFVVFSDEDEAISRFQVKKFYNYLSVEKKLIEFEDVKHTATPKDKSDANPLRPCEYNPHFSYMADELQKFLRKNFR
jgi:alpha-beta hydrolase superfamily lysophospholipase